MLIFRSRCRLKSYARKECSCKQTAGGKIIKDSCQIEIDNHDKTTNNNTYSVETKPIYVAFDEDGTFSDIAPKESLNYL